MIIVPWTPKELERVKTQWLDGYSAGEISKGLRGRSRNAVIGIAHRKGWIRTESAKHATMRAHAHVLAREPRTPRAPKVSGPRIYNPMGVKVTGDKTPARKPNAETIQTGHVAESAPKPWEQRGPDECAWIVETGDQGSISCCAPICKRGRLFSWCKSHARAGLSNMSGRGFYAPAEVFVERMGRFA